MIRYFDRLRRLLGTAAGAGLLALAFAIGLPEAAYAVDPADQAAYDAAFDQMERDPGNSDKTLTYAEAAIKVGDFEGAIGALERLLIFNPDLPSIQLEVGVLYYRLGSYDLARTYLKQILGRTDLPDEVRAKANEYLAQIDERSSPHHLSGNVTSGFRYQTNATYGPGGSGLSILGLGFPIPSNAAPKADANFFGLGTVNYVYDFQQADPLTLETNLTMYGQKQFKQTQFDLSLTQLDVGPRFGLPSLIEGASVRPYLVGDYLSLGGSHFFSSYGGGINGFTPVIDRLTLQANFEIQDRQYYTDPARPLIESRTGDFISIRVQPNYALADNQLLGFLGEFDRTLAVQGYERMSQYVLGPNYQIRFSSPVPQTGLIRPWTGTVSFTHAWRHYGEPEAIVDPVNTRTDSEFDLGGTLEIGVVRGFSTLLQIQKSWVNSNIPNYGYTNLVGIVAASFTF